MGRLINHPASAEPLDATEEDDFDSVMKARMRVAGQLWALGIQGESVFAVPTELDAIEVETIKANSPLIDPDVYIVDGEPRLSLRVE